MTTEAEPLFFEELHAQVKDLQPMVFDGVRLVLNRPLSSNFQLSHTLAMGMYQSSYRFGANYMGTKQVSPIESYPLLASEINCNGQLNGSLTHLINSRLKAKLVGSFAKHQCMGMQASLNYKGDNFTSTLTAANIDLIRNNGIIIGQLLHRATKSITLGPELVLQYATQEASLRTATQLSMSGRFTGDKYHVDATVSTDGAHISYCQRASDKLHFGAETLIDKTSNQSTAGFYYRYDLESHTTFRGSIDSAWSVSAVLEKRFLPLPIVLSMSAVLDHLKKTTTVGLGLTVG